MKPSREPLKLVRELPDPTPERPAAPPAGRHPLRFLAHYVARHPIGHAIVLASVLAAVLCSVSSQYGMKRLIDAIAAGPGGGGTAAVWAAFLLLCGLIAADNLLWRVGGWAAARSFVAVTGDVRRDMFAHLSGHSPSYFAERLPGALASRITATANAAFTVESTGAWNVLPPCFGVTFAIGLISTVNLTMAGALVDGGARPGRGDLRAGAERHAAASQICDRRGRGGRRAGGRDLQHGGGARVRGDLARAAPAGRDDRDRDGRPARAACSIWKSCG